MLIGANWKGLPYCKKLPGETVSIYSFFQTKNWVDMVLQHTSNEVYKIDWSPCFRCQVVFIVIDISIYGSLRNFVSYPQVAGTDLHMQFLWIFSSSFPKLPEHL